MRVLVDTNVILRSTQPKNQGYPASVAAISQLGQAGHELCLVPQAIYEYWVVATRPAAVNGLGMTAVDVDQQIQELLLKFTLLRDERGIYSRWYNLVVTHNVLGKQAHDTRLVAAMERHGVMHLLTFNKSDFARFPSIAALSPDDIISGILPA